MHTAREINVHHSSVARRVIDSRALGNSVDCLRGSTYAAGDSLVIHHMVPMHYRKMDIESRKKCRGPNPARVRA
jgi:hypothetical protein